MEEKNKRKESLNDRRILKYLPKMLKAADRYSIEIQEALDAATGNLCSKAVEEDFKR